MRMRIIKRTPARVLEIQPNAAFRGIDEAGFQVGVLEFIPALQQPVWQHPLAIENQSTGHFTEHDFEDKSGRVQRRDA